MDYIIFLGKSQFARTELFISNQINKRFHLQDLTTCNNYVMLFTNFQCNFNNVDFSGN